MTYTPFSIHGENRPGRWLITCDHAANTIPAAVNGGTLGLSDADMNRHIAYDVGAAGLTLELAKALNSTAILSNFSRLVIDPNRGEDDPTLVMKLYDGTIISGNRHVDADEIEARLDLCYRPYHRALAELAARPDTVILSIHSFTRQLEGRPVRPWEIGVLHADDQRLSKPLIAALAAQGGPPVGDNEPYGGHLPGDAVERHALQHGRPNVLIELRNDLIRTAQDQAKWATRLAPVLEDVLTSTNL
jgi:predicted N-formylglutamate amidohydrolase